MSFWSELKIRNVYKVGIAYAIVAWLILQVAAITFPALHLPAWALTLLTVLILLGFPLVLIFAWAFEITPEGLKWTKEVPHHESITHLTGQKLNYVVTGLLIIAVSYILFDNYYLDRRIIETKVASRVAELTSPTDGVKEDQKTIAVLPFVDLSPEKDQEYFVDGLTEELLNSLAQISELSVIARTSSFSFKGTNKTIQEIAGVLGVANILEGSVRKAGNALRITAQLVRAEDGSHLWSKTYDRELKDIFEVQEDIANTVAHELETKLGIRKVLQEIGGTGNTKAYELYMIAQAKYKSGPWELNNALESIDAAISLDPNYALAWATKSLVHSALSTAPTGGRTANQDAALSAAQKAIEIESELPAAHYSLGYAKMSKGDWIGAELAYRHALDLTTDPSLNYMACHPFHYECVANFQRANELLAAELRRDPLNQRRRHDYVITFLYLDDRQKFEAELDRGKKFLGDSWVTSEFVMENYRLLTAEDVPRDFIAVIVCPFGDNECVQQISSSEDLLLGIMELYDVTERNQIERFGDNPQVLMYISKTAAYFGDTELAANAMVKAVTLDYTNTGFIWAPVMKEIRQLPQFKKFIREIGLVDYWDKFGWPDICRPLGNGDFVCK